MTERHRPDDRPDDNVMGVRPGAGHDQYAGRVAGGESGGGAYPNPHSAAGKAAACNAEENTPRTGNGSPRGIGGQTHQGYYGGGQAGAGGGRDNDDHDAASRTSAPSDPGPDYSDHASQRSGAAREDFDAAVARATRGKP